MIWSSKTKSDSISFQRILCYPIKLTPFKLKRLSPHLVIRFGYQPILTFGKRQSLHHRFKVLGISFGKVIENLVMQPSSLTKSLDSVGRSQIKYDNLTKWEESRNKKFSIEGNKVSIDINADSLLDQTLEVSVEPLAYSDTISSENILGKENLGTGKRFTCMDPMSKRMPLDLL